MKDRYYSFLIPWFMDGSLALAQTAVPLLALYYGADAVMLGAVGWIPQLLRVPVCISAGRISEKTGRTRFIIPAAAAMMLASIGLALSRSYQQVLLLNVFALVSIGAFYPPLQALIGDVSKRGELTKNLGGFNLGWCVGGMVAAIGASWLIKSGLSTPLYVAAVGSAIAGILVATWKSGGEKVEAKTEEQPDEVPAHNSRLLIIGRLGHFTGFFAFSTVRVLFPKVGVTLGWDNVQIATVVAAVVAGQAGGMILSGVSPWWKGKVWPQIAAQSVMLMSSAVIALSSSPVVLGIAFFGIGASLSVAYTAALFHGLSDKQSLGKNAGIHESLVAGGNIAGCLLGGFAAQYISVRAPYAIVTVLAAACLVATAIIWSRRTKTACD